MTAGLTMRATMRPASPDGLHRWRANRADACTRGCRWAPGSHPGALSALPDGTVVAGNMRLRAARDLGWETVPTVFVDLDENRAREWALRDNASYGDWDDVALTDLLREMQDAGANLDLTGFDEQALAKILDGVEEGRFQWPLHGQGAGGALALATLSRGGETCRGW